MKTVATEDSAALIGLVTAFVGILAQLTGDPVWQAVASFLIGAMLVVAFGLGRDNMRLLIGESADPHLRRDGRGPGELQAVDEVADLLTMRIGTRRLLVAVQLDFARTLSSDEIEQVSTHIDDDLPNRFPDVEQLFRDATARTDRRPGTGGTPAADRAVDHRVTVAPAVWLAVCPVGFQNPAMASHQRFQAAGS